MGVNKKQNADIGDQRPEVQPHLKVDSRVLIQLGAELVSDAKQALLELVKNAYDADAPGCKIFIDTEAIVELTHSGQADHLRFFAESTENVELHFDDTASEKTGEILRTIRARGVVTVEDTGDGIPRANMETSWLVVSNSLKRNLSSGPKNTTKKGRTPLGDKGVGRLATMKLGDVLVLESATSPTENLQQIYFRWGDCMPGITLDEVPVVLNEMPNTDQFKGTRLKILGLSEPQYWKAPTRLTELAAELSRLISPFEAVGTFPVTIDLNRKHHALAPVTRRALSAALAQFTVLWSTQTQQLTLTAKFKKRIFRSNQKETAALYDTYLTKENDGLFDFLKSARKLKGYQISLSTDSEWYIVCTLILNSSEISTPALYQPYDDPGPFSAEINYFLLGRENDISSDEAKLRTADTEMLKKAAGVAILRDGFRIPIDGDWLGISLEATKGSNYGLRAGNTIGYFALTGAKNYKLIEKSDREAFVQNDAYRGFMRLATRAAKFANDFSEALRRSANDYLSACRDRKNAGSVTLSAPDFPSSLEALKRSVESVQNTRDRLKSAQERIRTQTVQARSSAEEVKRDLATDPKAAQVVSSVISRLEAASDEVDSALKEVDNIVKNIRNDHLSVVSVQKRFESLNEQIEGLYESAAVGLSARSFSHDIHTYIAEIASSNEKINTGITRSPELKEKFFPHVSAIRGSVREMHNTVSLIDPMLPAQRAILDTFDLKSFMLDYFEKRARTFEESKISFLIEARYSPTVKTHRGRLLQIIDNLARNSQYWLVQDATNGHREIRVTIHGDGFTISDSGPGVAPIVEETLFELFVSDKPRESKGGIGLFIVSQLVEGMGGHVLLLPEKNALGRRYKFLVDLSGVILRKDS